MVLTITACKALARNHEAFWHSLPEGEPAATGLVFLAQEGEGPRKQKGGRPGPPSDTSAQHSGDVKVGHMGRAAYLHNDKHLGEYRERTFRVSVGKIQEAWRGLNQKAGHDIHEEDVIPPPRNLNILTLKPPQEGKGPRLATMRKLALQSTRRCVTLCPLRLHGTHGPVGQNGGAGEGPGVAP